MHNETEYGVCCHYSVSMKEGCSTMPNNTDLNVKIESDRYFVTAFSCMGLTSGEIKSNFVRKINLIIQSFIKRLKSPDCHVAELF